MTDLSEIKKLASYRPTHKVRFVTAAALFDGHDASIKHHAAHPAEHGRRGDPPGPQPLGRGDRRRGAAEDVQGIAVSSYQGGHVEFFKYMIDLLRERAVPTSRSTAAAAA